MKLTGKKFILLILYTPNKEGKFNIPIAGRTRFMKTVFLFDKEFREDFEKDKSFEEINIPKFDPWHYGPFSKDLLNDLEFLINQQYIKVSIGKNAPTPAELAEYMYWVEDVNEFQSREYDEEIFELTDDIGIPWAAKIWALLSKDQERLLIALKDALNSAPLDRILDYVYNKYQKEGYTDKSVLRKKYLRF